MKDLKEVREDVKTTGQSSPMKEEDKKKREFKGKKRGNKRFSTPREGKNDFSFWNEYPDLMDIATRIPWMHVAGTPLLGQDVNVLLPNVAVQYYHPIPGVSKSATDPLNIMFRQLYLDMHRRYRGIGTYQASDIAITILCIESALELIVEAERIYGIMNAYPVKSRIQPEGLLRAMGYTSGFILNLKQNLADFRYGINRLVRIAKRLPLPAGMNFFKSHMVLNGFVYKDSEDERASLLVFQPKGYFLYQTTGDARCINSAGTAYYDTINRAYFANPNAFLSSIENALNKLLNDSDILRITSDFIACYGEENMQVLLPIEESYAVVPVYSESIINKWHNSERVLGVAGLGYGTVSVNTTKLTISTSGPTFAVYQENDVVISQPNSYAPGSSVAPSWEMDAGGHQSWIMNNTAEKGNTYSPHIADTWLPAPDEEHVCEAMLWKAEIQGLYNTGGTKITGRVLTCSTELMADLEVHRVSNSNIVGATTYYQASNITFNSSALTDGLCQFDWHPLLLHFSGSSVDGIHGDVDNVTTVDYATIQKIQDAALLSAFKVSVAAAYK